MGRIKFMSIEIDNLTLSEAIDEIDQLISNKKKEYVVTPNSDHIVKLEHNKEFLKAYKDAGLVLVDGTPIMWISKWYHTPLKEKITGPRLTDGVIKLAAERGYTVFFLGGKEGVALKAEQNTRARYSAIRTVGSYSPKLGFEQDQNEIDNIISIVNHAKPDVLICGISSPKTEVFLNKHMDQMDTHVALSVGAAIDFMAGNVSRCPKWINLIGFEWLYRFYKEPRRMFRRYFVEDVEVFRLALKYKRRLKI